MYTQNFDEQNFSDCEGHMFNNAKIINISLEESLMNQQPFVKFVAVKLMCYLV